MLPEDLALPYDWTDHLAADTSRIRNDLSYQALVPMEEALRRTVAWEHAHPPKQIDSTLFEYAAEDSAYAKTAAR
jgi:nucleoside-diphosphate-sugar epimerase